MLLLSTLEAKLNMWIESGQQVIKTLKCMIGTMPQMFNLAAACQHSISIVQNTL